MMALPPMQGERNSGKPDAREAFAGSRDVEIVSSDPGWIRLRLAPEMRIKQSIADFFRSQLNDLDNDLCDKLALALEELLGNSIEHGSSTEPKSAVELACVRTARMVLFYLKDAGSGFSLNSVPHAAVSNPPDEPLRHAAYRSQMGMRPGGYGIMLVKQIADELLYNEYGNEVIMIKYLDSPAH
jgi:anti-sigma regulatory factor (Ser/Thr protein kinase)